MNGGGKQMNEFRKRKKTMKEKGMNINEVMNERRKLTNEWKTNNQKV